MGVMSDQSNTSDVPRIEPLPEEEWPPGLTSLVPVTGALNVFTTLGRHPELFDAWIGFSGYLLLSKTICPRVRELIILRVAHVTGCEYEWFQHERLALGQGVNEDEIAALREPLTDYDWDPGERPALAAVDELHATSRVGDETWARLAGIHGEKALIEILMLIGQYTGLAYALNAMNVRPES
jgi:AhpD family alkylhydroperoxidase